MKLLQLCGKMLESKTELSNDINMETSIPGFLKLWVATPDEIRKCNFGVTRNQI